MTYTGKLQLVCQFAARIPEPVLRRCPAYLLSVSWMLTLNLRLEETRKIFGTVANDLQEHDEARRSPRGGIARTYVTSCCTGG